MNDFECPICLQEIEMALQTPCNHYFCKKCLTDWQNQEISTGRNHACPVCRDSIQKIRAEYNLLNSSSDSDTSTNSDETSDIPEINRVECPYKRLFVLLGCCTCSLLVTVIFICVH